ncbi:MAG: MFS transporter [Bacteroidia bacterium]
MNDSLKEKLLLVTLAFVQFTHVMDFMIMMPLSNLFMEDFHITTQQFGLLVASYNISAGIVSVLASFFIDRFDRRKVLLMAYAFFVLGTIACGFAPGYGFMITARVITGMFGGILSSSILSVVSDTFKMEKRASAMGAVYSGFSAAAILGVPAGSYIAAHFSWHVPFLFIGGLGLLVLIAIAIWVPTLSLHIEEARKRNPLKNIGEILANTNRLRALLLMALLMIGHFSIIPYIPNYMVGNVGLEKTDIAYIYLAGGLCSVVVMRVVGRLADLYGSRKVFIVLSLCSLLPILAITNLSPSSLAFVLFVTSFLFIFGGSRGIPAQTLISSTALPHQRGGFLSLNAATQQLASGLASFLGGLLIASGPNGTILHYEHVGWMAAAASLLAIPVALSVKSAENTQPATTSSR